MCNLAYSLLAAGKDVAEKAKLDEALTPPQSEDRERAMARGNEASMQQLGGFGLLAPPPKKE